MFGPERAMFGSNFPVDSLYSSFARLYETFDLLTSDFSEEDRQSLFSTTAMTAYEFNPATA
jgi:predicted TIM-barrel fold metal-dependent hydrolase